MLKKKLKEKSICFLSHSARIGGAEIVLLETLEILKSQNIKCYVLLPGYGELCIELKKINIPFKIIPYGLWVGKRKASQWERIKLIIRILISLPLVIYAIKSWKCNIVYTNTITICIGGIAAKTLRLPHIWHIHEFGYEDHGLIFIFGEKISYKIMNFLSSKIIVVSKALKQKYEKYIPQSKINVIYPSMHRVNLENDDFESIKISHNIQNIFNYPKRIIYRGIIIGSLTEGKRQEDAIRAIAELKKKGYKIELIIVGKGDIVYEEYLHAISKSLQLNDQVDFAGYLEDPIPLIRSSDFLLICSRAEAFGRVTIEAMLAGKPVIGTKSGATSELIQEGINGFLYDPGNYKNLADKIELLIKNNEMGTKLGENGEKWAKSFFKKERYFKELLRVLGIIGNQ